MMHGRQYTARGLARTLAIPTILVSVRIHRERTQIQAPETAVLFVVSRSAGPWVGARSTITLHVLFPYFLMALLPGQLGTRGVGPPEVFHRLPRGKCGE